MRGLATVILLGAALLWAPSAAFAAINSLGAPQVSPRSGTTSTTFQFAVTYQGAHPATSVRVAVANRSLAMTPASGTAIAGTWTASATLPSGSWAVTFVATVSKGNAPSLSGGTVSVAGPVATPVPSSGWSPDLPGPIATPAPTAAPPAPVTPAPTASPIAAPAAPATSTGPGTPSATDAPRLPGAPGTPEGAGVEGGAGSGSGGGPAGLPSWVSPGASPAPSLDAGPMASRAGELRSSDRSPDTIVRGQGHLDRRWPVGADGGLGLVLGLGLAGIAAVAMVGMLILLRARRRRTDDGRFAEAPAAASATPADPAPVVPSAVDGTLERSARRRASIRPEDDPIVAAMGLAEPAPRPLRHRAGQTAAGPGEPRVGRPSGRGPAT